MPLLITKKRLVTASFDPIDFGDIDRFLEANGRQDKAALLIFPSTNNLEALVDEIRRQDRWRVTSPASHRVHIEWKTEEGFWSSCMGFAPSLDMPVPRRLPAVALALWPGVQNRNKGDQVDFKDIPTALGPDEHARLLKMTTENVGQITTIDREWREVTLRWVLKVRTTRRPTAVLG